MTTADASRSPEGTESTWAYTHLPRALRRRRRVPSPRRSSGSRRRSRRSRPASADLQRARHVQAPGDLADADANLDGGALNGGTANLHQQLVLRPTRGLGRPETPVPGLFLASASAHPGGGVHGACGWNAAVAALGQDGRLGAARRALVRTAWARVLREEPPG